MCIRDRHTPQPIEPKNKSFQISFFMILISLLIEKKVKDNRIKKTKNHLQNANEIGGINSTPPRATIKLLAIKIGWIKSNR